MQQLKDASLFLSPRFKRWRHYNESNLRVLVSFLRLIPVHDSRLSLSLDDLEKTAFAIREKAGLKPASRLSGITRIASKITCLLYIKFILIYLLMSQGDCGKS